MFESLSERFGDFFRTISGKGQISESNVRDAMSGVRTALLEADVNQGVVDSFCQEVLRDALGQEVTKSLKPEQEMVGIVHRRLVELMAPPEGSEPGIMLVDPPPTVVMLCGLQGSGKTTTCGKLAALLKRRGVSCMVCAADLQRPAAVEQLRQVIDGVAADAPGSSRVGFYAEPERCAEYGKAVGVAVDVCRRALRDARSGGYQVLILDTAGRLHVNTELMTELQAIDRALQPQQVLLVVDAMTGQDAANSALAFHQRLNVDGIILTKFDSDTRGGAALSVKRVTGAAIRFVGTGEKFDALEEFHADRVAGRILGMGDVVSLVERAQQEVSEEEAERIAEKMAKGKLTMDDFLAQMRSIRRMGPLKQLLGLLPGMGAAMKGIDIDDGQLDRLEGIVNSMTRAERQDSGLIDRSRAKRIAQGSGVQIAEVTKLTKQFELMNRVTQQLAGLGPLGKMKAMRGLQSMDPSQMAQGALPGFGGRGGSTATPSIKSRFKKRR
jgi:signal recognition particle subunit SRP54